MVERGLGPDRRGRPRVLTDGTGGQAGPLRGGEGGPGGPAPDRVAREVAGTGVTANLIAVKAIDVDGVRDREPSPKTAGWSTPDEIVATMRWLCSDDAAAVNGVRLPLGR